MNSMNEYIIPSVAELKEKTEHGNHKFEIVSTFAGGGGSSLGYRMAGGKVLAIVEFIDEACKTYRANWQSTKIIQKDIRQVTGQEILDAIGKQKGELDILDGSPPCSAFSTAGSREKGWGKTKKYSDSAQANVEDLFFEYIRILRDVQPKVFVAENVSGLVKGSAKGYFNHIMRELQASGYVVTCKVLDAKHLGVPQSRNRTIFVGIRQDLWEDKYKGNTHPKPFDYMVTLEQAFKGLQFTDQDKKETDLSRFKVYNLLTTLKAGEQHSKAFTLVKASPKSQSPCIKATTGNIGARESYHWNNRAFTVDEIKRIMSVPDDFILTGTYQQKVERMGRMVAPFMMREVAKQILSLGVLNANS
ncbi:DNA (cytosine-5-)-methyltransferase [Moraxella catarrhalis]|uniref:DNA cytosine methyltransferase n=2 Tax=Moraxella catarrhalis TaxID=480 RepID=UPI000EA86BEA|nr:DNA (cytosine-5-)-methyltransferase [Moraxella catarrhalis]MPW78216.1 DNA (cytosine-5-)-methyltransferase [Moraxella catarrhalis]RKL74618.1 DNA (cytosine-5-)-methyltransferase [Moraxella catarrhalis]RKM32987.1 DNA (cytosine-5-)-methyltransferase [Moraxella catarrhalis]